LENRGVDGERPADRDPIVAPSGSALATASVPRLPLAPGLFSITKLWPSFCCNRSAISRATKSGVEPGPNGTTILTVFVGQSCAAAGTSASSDPANAIARLVFIQPLAFVAATFASLPRPAGGANAPPITSDRIIASPESRRMPTCRGHGGPPPQGDRLAYGPAIASTAPA
jgi:hypothetical protein